MFFSYDLIKSAYSQLMQLDSSDGKSRKEKISGLRYLIATSQLLHQENSEKINLAVGSRLRSEFIDAVGNVVALNNQGLYSKDFANEFDIKNDYGVGSNFFTTRLANSRSRNIKYPGRPAHLLFLEQEHASILANVNQTLIDSYGIGSIKAELCLWLLRNEDLNAIARKIPSDELKTLIGKKLVEKYTTEIVEAITPTESELENFISGIYHDLLVDKKPDYSDIALITEEIDEVSVHLVENPDLYKEITVEEEDTGTPLKDDQFNPSEINIDVKSPTISILIDRLKQKPPEIDLYADFQRSDDLWTNEKQSQLIESILIKFPLPAFYFDGSVDENWLVVDGLQRLSSLRNFMITKTLTLSGLEFLKHLNGAKYNDLSRTLTRVIDQTQIIAYIIRPGTPVKVKYNIFKRINTGGLVLEPQEIRHALNQGLPAQFVAQLAKLKEFKTATENKINPSRMLDREFVTRFVAFYLNKPEEYTPDLDSFLNNAMSQIDSLTEDGLRKIKEDFRQSMITASKIFGSWAFRKADLYPYRRKPISKALFEVWSVSLAQLTDEERETLISNKQKVMKGFSTLCATDASFWNSISSGTGEKTRIATRFNKIKDFLMEILND